MSKPSSDSKNTIERLLQDRAQFVSWLTRLNSSGDGGPPVPEAVRSRVRSDYERRLESVLEELRTHTNALEEQVTSLTTKQRDLTVRESEFKEQLSEAEVRHMVGEYDESKWEGIRAEMMKVILQVREELGHTGGEIARLSDVLSTIRAPVVAVAPAPEPEPEVAPPLPSLGSSAPRPMVSGSAPRPTDRPVEPVAPPPAEPARPGAAAAQGTSEIPFRPMAPRPPQPKAPAPAAAPKKEEVPGRTLWFPSGKPNEQGGGKLDELAFLKSVTPADAPAATPAPATKPRASGGFTRPATIEPPANPPAPEPGKATAAPQSESVKDRQSGAKTLKCGECGTLNRPTEWYCERCGAELAAL